MVDHTLQHWEVSALDGGGKADAFLDVARRIYADDPWWIAPLDLERKAAWAPSEPCFEHIEWQRWLARDGGGEPVGRISAQIDTLYQQRYDDRAGFFGLIEAQDQPQLWEALLGTAEAWARERGMERLRGPFDLSINQQLGLLVDGFDSHPFFLMGHARRWYARRLEAAGYRGVKDLLAYLITPRFERPQVFSRLLDRLGSRLRVRPLDRSRVTEELQLLRDIFNDAWANNWGFVPFTEKEFDALGRELMLVLPKDFVQIAEVDDEAAAFIVMLPNINEAVRDLNGRLLPFGWARALWRLKVAGTKTARVPLMGVRQGFQSTRYGPGLAFAVIEAADRAACRAGVGMVEMSWILEDNANIRGILEAIGATVSRRYRIYEKSLVSGGTDIG